MACASIIEHHKVLRMHLSLCIMARGTWNMNLRHRITQGVGRHTWGCIGWHDHRAYIAVIIIDIGGEAIGHILSLL